MFELLESFCKQIVPPVTEHDDVIETQTKNCMRSQIAHATPLVCCIKSLMIAFLLQSYCIKNIICYMSEKCSQQ